MSKLTRVIITGDDFGLSGQCNAGIIAAHNFGTLSSASLMVAGDAASEAIDLARSHPLLAVGLHINFSDTKPILSPEEVSLLVQSNGRFPEDDSGFHKALRSTRGRRQLRAEIAAQFHAFYETGLPFDHVNTHRHAHRNLLLAWMIFQEAARWHVRVTRIPWDPPKDPLRYARAALLRKMARAHQMYAPQRAINRRWRGKLADFIRTLPPGTIEIFFHPIIATDHQFAADLPTLLDPDVKAALADVTLCGMRLACTPRPSTPEFGTVARA